MQICDIIENRFNCEKFRRKFLQIEERDVDAAVCRFRTVAVWWSSSEMYHRLLEDGQVVSTTLASGKTMTNRVSTGIPWSYALQLAGPATTCFPPRTPERNTPRRVVAATVWTPQSHDIPITVIALSAMGALLVLHSNGPQIELVSCVFLRHAGLGRQISVHPSGSCILIAGDDGSARIYPTLGPQPEDFRFPRHRVRTHGIETVHPQPKTTIPAPPRVSQAVDYQLGIPARLPGYRVHRLLLHPGPLLEWEGWDASEGSPRRRFARSIPLTHRALHHPLGLLQGPILTAQEAAPPPAGLRLLDQLRRNATLLLRGVVRVSRLRTEPACTLSERISKRRTPVEWWRFPFGVRALAFPDYATVFLVSAVMDARCAYGAGSSRTSPSSPDTRDATVEAEILCIPPSTPLTDGSLGEEKNAHDALIRILEWGPSTPGTVVEEAPSAAAGTLSPSTPLHVQFRCSSAGDAEQWRHVLSDSAGPDVPTTLGAGDPAVHEASIARTLASWRDASKERLHRRVQEERTLRAGLACWDWHWDWREQSYRLFLQLSCGSCLIWSDNGKRLVARCDPRLSDAARLLLRQGVTDDTGEASPPGSGLQSPPWGQAQAAWHPEGGIVAVVDGTGATQVFDVGLNRLAWEELESFRLVSDRDLLVRDFIRFLEAGSSRRSSDETVPQFSHPTVFRPSVATPSALESVPGFLRWWTGRSSPARMPSDAPLTRVPGIHDITWPLGTEMLRWEPGERVREPNTEAPNRPDGQPPLPEATGCWGRRFSSRERPHRDVEAQVAASASLDPPSAVQLRWRPAHRTTTWGLCLQPQRGHGVAGMFQASGREGWTAFAVAQLWLQRERSNTAAFQSILWMNTDQASINDWCAGFRAGRQAVYQEDRDLCADDQETLARLLLQDPAFLQRVRMEHAASAALAPWLHWGSYLLAARQRQTFTGMESLDSLLSREWRAFSEESADRGMWRVALLAADCTGDTAHRMSLQERRLSGDMTCNRMSIVLDVSSEPTETESSEGRWYRSHLDAVCAEALAEAQEAAQEAGKEWNSVSREAESGSWNRLMT